MNAVTPSHRPGLGRSRDHGAILALAVVRWVLGLFWGIGMAEATAGPPNEVLTIGLTRTAFLNVNRNDMEAALKTLAVTIGRRYDYEIEVRTSFYEEAKDFADAVRSGAVRMAVTDSWTYLAMDPATLGAKPWFVAADSMGVGKVYHVLTRRGSGLDRMADLRGKTLALLEIVNSSLGRPWLETVLRKDRLGSLATFFRQTVVASKPTTAVLPVFFGKSDACLVDASAFAVMSEMNPQVGKALQIIASSEPLVDGLQLLSEAGWEGSERMKQHLIEVLRDLHSEPSGQQLLTLFKTVRMVPFEAAHLEAVRGLRTIQEQSRTEVSTP